VFISNLSVLLGDHYRFYEFEKFVDWWQSAAVMQMEVVAIMPSCSGGDNIVMA
jgi:hypothetical protein